MFDLVTLDVCPEVVSMLAMLGPALLGWSPYWAVTIALARLALALLTA